MTLGQQIAKARRRAGLTNDRQFAAEIGVSIATLHAWEAEIETPSDEQLQRIAEATGLDGAALSHLARMAAPKGICSPVDLVPGATQAEALEQVGLPKQLWSDADRWIAFLRLARAASTLPAAQISLLSDRAEACVLEE